MGKISRKLPIIIILLLVNIFIIYDLVDAILTKANIWVPIIMLLIEIGTIIIYRYIGQFGERLGSIDHNPNY